MSGVLWRVKKIFSIHVVLTSFAQIILQIYSTLQVMLAAVVSYAASADFKSIASQLRCWKKDQISSLTSLPDLKRCYVQASQTVDEINECFGWSLSLILSCHFITVVNASFYLFDSDTPTLSEIFFFVFYFSNLLIICIAADSIRIQVRNLKTVQLIKLLPCITQTLLDQV